MAQDQGVQGARYEVVYLGTMFRLYGVDPMVAW